MSDKNLIELALMKRAGADAIERMLAESGGEFTPEIEAFLAVDVTLPEKIDGYKAVMDRVVASAEEWKKKAAAYAAMAKSMNSVQERLENRIKEAMKILGVTELTGNEVRFKLKKTAPKLVLDDALLEDYYKMSVTEIVPDKARIKAALQEGAAIEGASLEVTGSLQAILNKREK